jgi:hypothetical protein
MSYSQSSWSCLFFVLYNLHTDVDKGFNSTFPTTFNDVGQFDCSKHKGENLVKHGTKGDKEVYEKVIHATSTLELQHLKSKCSSKGAAYLVITPDDRLYLVSSLWNSHATVARCCHKWQSL